MPAPTPETDVLGEPYTAETIVLPDDDEGPVLATLVSRPASRPTGRAVLHVHGFADYFFQTVAADYWVARDYDFYALDLRKYGRSLLPHQTPNFVTDLAEHYPEIDAAVDLVRERDGHDHLVVSGHSTGGLITALWAHDRRPGVAAMVLNSPWLDLQASLLQRTLGTALLDVLGAVQPRFVVPRTVSGLYAESLHRDHSGEWEFDLRWKPVQSWPVLAGWLRAVRRGQARVHRGIDAGAPVLVLTSDASATPTAWDDTVTSHDIVLDVDQIRRWSDQLAPHVTLAPVEGAMHDVTLSRAPVRERVFDEISRWLDAYVDHAP